MLPVISATAERGRWINWSDGSLFGRVTWFMGQCMLTIILSAQQVIVKYRQKFALNTPIMVDSDISAFSKEYFVAVGK